MIDHPTTTVSRVSGRPDERRSDSGRPNRVSVSESPNKPSSIYEYEATRINEKLDLEPVVRSEDAIRRYKGIEEAHAGLRDVVYPPELQEMEEITMWLAHLLLEAHMMADALDIDIWEAYREAATSDVSHPLRFKDMRGRR